MAGDSERIQVIVPVFNEVDNLERLFGGFLEFADRFGKRGELHLILVDDGSSDGTADRARELGKDLNLTVLRHEQNKGPGEAFGTGFEALADSLGERDWVVTMEGDNTSRHELLDQMLTRTDEGYDVVLASPYMYGGGMTNTGIHRVLLSHAGNLFVKELLGIRGILTMSSFYRLYSADTIRRLQACFGPRIVERAGFECMIELLMKMVVMEMRISEVPMVLDTSRRAGKSKMKLMRTVRGYLTLGRRKGAWKRCAQSD
jgi:dolichol-phosphate mannosyltransferase